MTYKLIKDFITGKTDQCVQYTDSSSIVKLIPYDEDNTDYVIYKAWLDAGNTPEAAD